MENNRFGFSRELSELLQSYQHPTMGKEELSQRVEKALRDAGIKSKINLYQFIPEIIYGFPGAMFPGLEQDKRFILCTGWTAWLSIDSGKDFDFKEVDREIEISNLIMLGLAAKLQQEEKLEVGKVSIPSFCKISILCEFKDFEHFLCLQDEVEGFKEEVLRPFNNAEEYQN